MSVKFHKPQAKTVAVIKNAFLFADNSFHENDIDRSILSKFLGEADFELSDQQVHFLTILLEEYRKSLMRKKRNTPKHLSGYRHACESLPVVKELLSSLGEDLYSPTPLEKRLYEELFDLFQLDKYHVDFTIDKYHEQFPQIQEALKNLEAAGILHILDYSDSLVTVELNYNYCYTFVDL